MTMLKFKIHSPGKVIIHGEHAVVYNRPALAAAIGLGTKLKFQEQPESQLAKFHLETLNCILEIEMSEFNTFLSSYRTKHPDDKLESTATLLEEVRAEVAKQMERNIANSTQQHQTQKAFLSIYYLLAGALLSAPENGQTLLSGMDVHIDSELNLGGGLGSSASFGAALAATFLIMAGHFDKETYLQEENLEIISHWAFESERIMHNTPSGVDNTVCTYGGMLRFVKGQGFSKVQIQKPLNILLVDSRVSRSTADVVARVRHMGETFPGIFEAIWQACEIIVDSAVPVYESYGNGQDDSAKFEKLERLMQINNDLLKAVGVSHPKLEQIFTLAFRRGFFSKLTGAGAGGFAIVLLPEKYKEHQAFWSLKEELEAAGFGVHATTAGGDGLRVTDLKE